MDDREKILSLLAEGPAEVADIASKTGLRRTRLASLLSDLEEKKQIVWGKNGWRRADSPEPDRD